MVRERETLLTTGNYLSHLTDELNGDFTDFVAAGPKSYTNLNGLAETAMRAKGIIQILDSCKKVNFDGVRWLVEGYIRNLTNSDAITVPQYELRQR